MGQIMEQMPVVVEALNVGFLQTLKLFFYHIDRGIPTGADHCIRINVAVFAAQFIQ